MLICANDRSAKILFIIEWILVNEFIRVVKTGGEK